MAEEGGRVPLSPALHKTLLKAREYAASQSQPQVLLEHLLLALTEDTDATPVLSASEVDVARLRNDVAGYIGSMQERLPPGVSVAPAISPGLTQVLRAATAAAQQGRRQSLDGAIVLAALIGDGRSMAASFLKAQGLTFEATIRVLREGALRPAAGATTSSPTPAALIEEHDGSEAEAPLEPSPAVPPPAGSQPSSRADDLLAAARERVVSRTGGRSARPVAPSPAAEPAPEAEVAAPEAGRTPAAGMPVAPEAVSIPDDEAVWPGPAVAPTPLRAADELPLPDEDEAQAHPAEAGPGDGGGIQDVVTPTPPMQERYEPVAPPAETRPQTYPGQSFPPHATPGGPAIPAPPPARGASRTEDRAAAPAMHHADAEARDRQPRMLPRPDRRQPSTEPAPRQAAPPPPHADPRNYGEASPVLTAPPAIHHHPPAGDPAGPAQPGPPSPVAWAPPAAPVPPGGPGYQSGAPARPQPAPPPGGWQGRPVPPSYAGRPHPQAPEPYPSSGVPWAESPDPRAARGLADTYRPTSPQQDLGSDSARPAAPARSSALEPSHVSHSVARRMRLGRSHGVEVRIERPALAGHGPGARPASLRGEAVVARAIAVRLRSAAGRFSIDQGSPETIWDQASGPASARLSADAAVWRFSVTPLAAGKGTLQLSVSARTVGADGVLMETTLPDLSIEIRSLPDVAGSLRKAGISALAFIGGMIVIKAIELIFYFDAAHLVMQLVRH
ncbi:MAG: Clp protease N-terminal domain-containing protein [Hyphomicrobiaceae bacterium]|nr:Clp protease N-terminal domain-containing protein [Hyphomicrobiaceae bacterium]